MYNVYTLCSARSLALFNQWTMLTFYSLVNIKSRYNVPAGQMWNMRFGMPFWLQTACVPVVVFFFFFARLCIIISFESSEIKCGDINTHTVHVCMSVPPVCFLPLLNTSSASSCLFTDSLPAHIETNTIKNIERAKRKRNTIIL